MLIDEVKQKISAYIRGYGYKPLKATELINEVFSTEVNADEFNKAIKEMQENGEIFINKKGKIATLEHFNMEKGKFASTKRGFGFVEVSPDKDDIFIRADDRNSAFDGDEVIVKVTNGGGVGRRAEGVIVSILHRANTEVVGTFIESKNFAFVIPDNKKFDQDVFIPRKCFNGAKNNDKVVCEIYAWPENNMKPEGRITEVIGQKGERYVEIDSIVRAHGLPDGFPENVDEYIKNIPLEVSEEEMKGRLDLRDHLIYTIDGDDSKDFDDAVEVELLENGNYRLGVHIADVTHYVKENSPLDREALKRATSVYLVDKVIPMLPKKLSNGICSLNPGVDRLTLSCIMEIEPKHGKVVDYDIRKSVIRSKARMTYHKVSEILENNDKELCEEYKDFLESFRNAEKLAAILKKKRDKRGAINFDFPESYIKLDEKGVPVDIKPYEIRVSNKMIEEFMLETNETIAQHYYWLKLPFVYRVHEQPADEKIIALRAFVNEMGYSMHQSRAEVKPSDLQKVLDEVEDKEEKKAIAAVMLRSMRQARYAPQCMGHFGLAANYYCHFTSPIRRYPDLQIHRIIKENLDGKLNSGRITHYEGIVEEVSNQSSTREREADLAERDVDDYYKAVYMEDKIGEIFDGHISGVTSFGIFVELENGVEGLIRSIYLPGEYDYNEKSHSLVGKRNGKVFRLGQKVRIEVEDVNVDAKEIDFVLAR